MIITFAKKELEILETAGAKIQKGSYVSKNGYVSFTNEPDKNCAELFINPNFTVKVILKLIPVVGAFVGFNAVFQAVAGDIGELVKESFKLEKVRKYI